MNDSEHDVDEVVSGVSKALSFIRPSSRVLDRPDGPYLVLEVARPNERWNRALRKTLDLLPEANIFKARAAISQRKTAVPNRLLLPETQLLKATLSESLTVDRHTFSEDFYSRYTRSVSGFEDQIVAESNHVVFGRRGSGKSSLLAYAMHQLAKQKRPFAWVSMQAFSHRSDVQVDVAVMTEVVNQLANFALDRSPWKVLRLRLNEMAEQSEAEASRALSRIPPQIARHVAALSRDQGAIVIFIDDLHLLPATTQARLLGFLYSFSRGNRCFLKASGIEQFCRLYDAKAATGLEVPHDTQVLKLDYNLTMPDRSKSHIGSILDAHAAFCGLPDIAYISGNGVLSRLVWVSAGVPRDALNLFALAVTKGTAQGQKRVSITSINAAASEVAEQKMRDIASDATAAPVVQSVLNTVKTFCVQDKRTNAFLVEIANESSGYQAIQALIALRLVHVLHEGITPHEAGRRYQALLLDYGFYVGIRAAKSVELFHKEPKTPSVQELRKLPILPLLRLEPDSE